MEGMQEFRPVRKHAIYCNSSTHLLHQKQERCSVTGLKKITVHREFRGSEKRADLPGCTKVMFSFLRVIWSRWAREIHSFRVCTGTKYYHVPSSQKKQFALFGQVWQYWTLELLWIMNSCLEFCCKEARTYRGSQNSAFAINGDLQILTQTIYFFLLFHSQNTGGSEASVWTPEEQLISSLSQTASSTGHVYKVHFRKLHRKVKRNYNQRNNIVQLIFKLSLNTSVLFIRGYCRWL